MEARTRRTAIAHAAQIILIGAAFCLVFAHGILLGEHNIGFHPAYRLREALAVAISRMREPPLGGYLAYQSVINSLNKDGFASLPWDVGPRLNDQDYGALVTDAPRLDRILQDASRAPIDPRLPPDLTRGNEVAYADYVYIAFALFGIHMSSLYYLYFLIVGVSGLLFVVQYRDSPILMFLLLTYLGGLGFLQNYAQSGGIQLATLYNSRLFEALSLLPAFHIFMLVWRREPPRLFALAAAVVQSALLAFIIDCRISGDWQIVMVVATSIGFIVIDALKLRHGGSKMLLAIGYRAWPAAIAAAILLGHMAAIDAMADPRYQNEPKYHVIWHEVLRGLLGSNTGLQREYLGKVVGLGSLPDQSAYDAIDYDLTLRNDRTSPIVVVQQGRIRVDVSKGWGEYERLARSLALKMVLQHPGQVLAGLYTKSQQQLYEFKERHALSLANLAGAALLTALGALVWLMRGGQYGCSLGEGLCATAIVLAFAAVPPLIAPSSLSVGTLLTYLIALCLAGLSVVILIARAGQTFGVFNAKQ
jgi:hypothetical protein